MPSFTTANRRSFTSGRLELEQTGDRIILRIDTRDGQAQIERLDIVEPTPTRSTRDEALEARKIG